MSERFFRRKIVVTGAGGDIGQHICMTLADNGAEVVRGTHDVVDVTSTESIRSFLGYAWARGPFDGLVTAHGAPGCIKPTATVSDDEWQRIIDVDLTGTFKVCREVSRYLCTGIGGSIVNLSSMHAVATYPQRACYAAAKAGVVGLTKALAVEWAQRGVTVNAVLPGQVEETRRTARIEGNPRLRERSPSGRLVRPEAVAEAVMYLLEAKGVNGHTLVVDDGWTSSAWWDKHAATT